MELVELLNSVKVIQVIGEVQRKDISGIFYDSRKVKRDSVFAAIKGFNTDGHSYIMNAINQGAAAVIMESNPGIPDELFVRNNIAKILVKDSRKALAEISSAYYKYPSEKLNMIGVTGTNGKTTTTYILKSILENAGHKTGLLGTIANYIGDEKVAAKLTTPESSDLNELLLNMHQMGCTYCVMEVSSHSLVLRRVHNIRFRSALFTNITSDHLDFHGSFGEYLTAKKIMFDELGEGSPAVVNSDDEHTPDIIRDTKGRVFYYGTKSGSDYRITNIQYDLNGTRFTLECRGKRYGITTTLIGEFNAYNAAAAFAAGSLSGIDEDTICEGISKTPYVPGRFEVIGKGTKKAVVDYSHTADSLEKALTALRKLSSGRKIVTVFGCGGNRDKTKRPVMGRIAGELSDSVIITSDNPRFEDPYQIIEEIKKGIKNSDYKVIEDRHEAIRAAIKESPEDALILIAGKGHEDYQDKNGVKNHFSDKETAEKYLD